MSGHRRRPRAPGEPLTEAVARRALHAQYRKLIEQRDEAAKPSVMVDRGSRAHAVADCCALLGIERPDSEDPDHDAPEPP